MKTRFLVWSFLSLFVGALALLSGCSSSGAVTPAGLWSCFDTGSGLGCVKQSALSTADVDVNGDGVPDHFVCADDDDDNPGRHETGEVDHHGGGDDGGGDHHDDDGTEMHAEGSCTPPTI
jgi:hypothetical protein